MNLLETGHDPLNSFVFEMPFSKLDVLMALFISHLKLKCGNYLGLGERDTFYQ